MLLGINACDICAFIQNVQMCKCEYASNVTYMHYDIMIRSVTYALFIYLYISVLLHVT